MKRLMIISILTVGPVLLAGCNSAWPRCWSFRGDECTTSYPTCETAPMMTEGMMMSPTVTMPETLPGPVTTTPST